MRTITGIQSLAAARDSLPTTGWIFVDRDFDKDDAQGLLTARFQIAENEDEEFWGEDHLATWLEAPTFLAVLTLREKNLKAPTATDHAEAAIHYLRKDDFLE